MAKSGTADAPGNGAFKAPLPVVPVPGRGKRAASISHNFHA